MFYRCSPVFCFIITRVISPDFNFLNKILLSGTLCIVMGRDDANFAKKAAFYCLSLLACAKSLENLGSNVYRLVIGLPKSDVRSLMNG